MMSDLDIELKEFAQKEKDAELERKTMRWSRVIESNFPEIELIPKGTSKRIMNRILWGNPNGSQY